MILVQIIILVGTTLLAVISTMLGQWHICAFGVVFGVLEYVSFHFLVYHPLQILMSGETIKFGSVEVIWLQKKIQQLNKSVVHLDMLACHDQLTGLYNRTHLEEQKKLVYANSDEVFVVSFDVNNLKLMNDTYGHEAGDILLKNAARSLNYWSVYGEVYRVGGDEFLAVIHDRVYADCMQILDDWENTCLFRLNRSADEFECRIAYGFAYGKDFDEVNKEADEKMYANKRFVKQWKDEV